VGENLRSVAIGEFIVSEQVDDVLVSYGLGSCVAVCLYDSVTGVGGMLHALLPAAPNPEAAHTHPAKFVEHGVPLLIQAMAQRGARRSRLRTALCGGGQVLAVSGVNGKLHIGERNVDAAKTALQTAGLAIQAQDTGGQVGRTVKFHIANGHTTVKTFGKGEQALF